jgi:exonuclease III
MVSSKGDVINLLRTNKFASYSAFFNSTKNKRGVAILINNNLSFSVEAEICDEDENVLLLRCNIGGDMCIIGAIYGPNNFDVNFFEFLHREVTALGDYPIVLGGDWNITFSNLPIDVNPDCCNMVNLPNLRHSEMLLNLCDELRLTDPFRALYPTKIDFSYNPRRMGAVNRSRIDFFILSDELLNRVDDCYIVDHLQSSLFDHKAVNLNF